MNHRRLEPQSLLIVLLLLGIAGSIQDIPKVHAVGTLSIQPSNVTVRPSGKPAVVNIRVDQLDKFNGWDIAVSTDTTALNPMTVINKTESIFPQQSLFPAIYCVNNVGQNCVPGVDGPGVAHIAAVFAGDPSQIPPAPISGVLFGINYTAGSYPYTNIHFLKYQIVYGGPDVPHVTSDGQYGTSSVPDFRLQLPNQSLGLHQGRSANSTLDISSVNNFLGRVNLTYTPNVNGVIVTGPSNLTLTNPNFTLTIQVKTTVGKTNPSPGSYQINITGTSGPLHHSVLIFLEVHGPPTIVVGSPAGLIQIPQATSGSTTITVTSDEDFVGNVNLYPGAPKSVIGSVTTPCNSCSVSLADSSLYVPLNGFNSTTFSISVPPSSFAYNYLINVTAYYVQNKNVNSTYTVRVTPLPWDLTAAVKPAQLTITAGQSGFATLYITSENYFIGSVYASSTLTGGTAAYNESTVFLGISQTASFSLNVTIDPATTPGNYVVLLTYYSGSLLSGVVIAHTIGEPIVVKASSHSPYITTHPNSILSLPVPVYFGILGGFAALFVLLSTLVYRRNRSDKDESWLKE